MSEHSTDREQIVVAGLDLNLNWYRLTTTPLPLGLTRVSCARVECEVTLDEIDRCSKCITFSKRDHMTNCTASVPESTDVRLRGYPPGRCVEIHRQDPR